MRKLLFALPLLLLAGCDKENSEVEFDLSDDNTPCSATIEGVKAESLKTLVVRDGNVYKQAWTIGDEFKVHHSDMEKHYTTKYPDGIMCEATYEIKEDGKFYKKDGFKSSANKDHLIYAYYPASGYKGYVANGVMSVTLPKEQIYLDGGKVGKDLYPMYAVTSSTDYNFRNVAAILIVSLKAKDDDLVVKSISMSSSEINMSGDATVSFDSDGNPLLVMDPIASGKESIPAKLVCKDGVPLVKGQAVSFSMVVPPHTYKGNTMKITVETDKGSCTYNIGSTIDVKRSTGKEFIKNLNITLSAGGIGIEGDIAD